MKNTKTLMAIAMMVMTSAASARADGFECRSLDGILSAKLYNYTNPRMGTRKAAVLTLSDTRVQAGRQAIARITEAEANLSSQGTFYRANVDLRFANSGRAGEYIAGTRLGELDVIYMGVKFNYSQPVAEGAHVPGFMNLMKRNGQSIRLPLDCIRYVKN